MTSAFRGLLFLLAALLVLTGGVSMASVAYGQPSFNPPPKEAGGLGVSPEEEFKGHCMQPGVVYNEGDKNQWKDDSCSFSDTYSTTNSLGYKTDVDRVTTFYASDYQADRLYLDHTVKTVTHCTDPNGVDVDPSDPNCDPHI